jgi:hypothetical protein
MDFSSFRYISITFSHLLAYLPSVILTWKGTYVCISNLPYEFPMLLCFQAYLWAWQIKKLFIKQFSAPSVTSSLLGTNIRLSTKLSNPLNLLHLFSFSSRGIKCIPWQIWPNSTYTISNTTSTIATTTTITITLSVKCVSYSFLK